MMAQRRAERKREIEKNKKKREGYREAALKYADPEKLHLEISHLQRQQLSQTDAKQDNLLKKRLEELQKHLRVCLAAKKSGDDVPEDSTLAHVSGLDFLGEEEVDEEFEEGEEGEEDDTDDDDEEKESKDYNGKVEDGEEEVKEREEKTTSSHPPLPRNTLNSADTHATGKHAEDDDGSEWEFEEDVAGDEEDLGGKVEKEKATIPPQPMPFSFHPPLAAPHLQAPYFPPPLPSFQFPPHPMYPLPPPFPLPPGCFPPPLPLQAGNYQPTIFESQTFPQKRGREGDRQAFKPGKRPSGKPELDANDPLAKAYSGDKLVHLNRTFDAAPTVASDKTDPVLQKHLSHPPSFLAASFPPAPPLLASSAHATTTAAVVAAKQPPQAPPKLPPGMKALVPSALRRPLVASSGGDAVKVVPNTSSAPAPAPLPTSLQTLTAALSAPVAAPSSVSGPRGVAILRRPEGVAIAPPPPAHHLPAEDPLGAFFAELEELTK